jgi:hypothetical protein
VTFVRFLPFLCTFFLSFTLAASQHNQSLSDMYTQEWLEHYIMPLQQEEILVIMNVLYVLYANAIIELEIRRFFTPMSHLVQSIKVKILSYDDVTEDLATLKTLTERLSYIAGARTIYNQILSQCFNYYNNDYDYIQRLSPALEAIQNYGADTLINWSNENHAQIALTIKTAADNFDEGARYLHEMSTFFTTLPTGAFPVDSEEKNRNLMSLDIFLHNSTNASNIIQELLDAINTSNDQTTELISTAHRLFKTYYESIYNHMHTSSFDQKYTTTLFGMHGLLPQEYRSQLPDSPHIFEHVLQTTKLYTSTQLLHS